MTTTHVRRYRRVEIGPARRAIELLPRERPRWRRVLSGVVWYALALATGWLFGWAFANEPRPAAAQCDSSVRFSERPPVEFYDRAPVYRETARYEIHKAPARGDVRLEAGARKTR